jgi:ATP-dependent Clp protease adaptor protein ClpS
MPKLLTKLKKNKTQAKIKKPYFYEVILLNDDFTTMEFVVKVLQLFFNMTKLIANKIMLKIHNEGSAVCGVYPYEVAETIVLQVISFAKQNQYPLKCIMKKSI